MATRAIILAAGRGSRMQQLTDTQPKCLLQVQGKSLLDWQQQALRQAGVSEIAVVTGYAASQLAGRAEREFHNPRWAETNMVSSLACAAEWLEAGPCVLSYADLFYPAAAVELLLSSSASLALTYDQNWLGLWQRRFGDPLRDAESFKLSQQGQLLEIGQKPLSVEAIQGQYMGLVLIRPDGWHELQRLQARLSPAERDRISMTELLQKVLELGQEVIEVLPYQGWWGEVDTVADLALYNQAAAYV